MDSKKLIYQRIPHRDPFLWIDTVTEINENHILAQKHFSPDLNIFEGHYPHYPLVPGVLLCEASFQAGALLISEILRKNAKDAEIVEQVPVLTRIQGAKFKREVHPRDTIEIDVRIIEKVSNAWFMKGKILVKKKVAVKVEFCLWAHFNRR